MKSVILKIEYLPENKNRRYPEFIVIARTKDKNISIRFPAETDILRPISETFINHKVWDYDFSNFISFDKPAINKSDISTFYIHPRFQEYEQEIIDLLNEDGIFDDKPLSKPFVPMAHSENTTHNIKSFDYTNSFVKSEMGFSDDDIDTILDGDPNAYWNID